MKQLTSQLSIPLLALFSAFALSGCAAMFSGGSQKVVFTAPQPQSSVTVEEKQYALPATVKISKKTTTATFTNPKYRSKELAWKRDFQVGFLFMDILFTPGYGLVGIIVDSSTAAWMKHPQVIDYDFAAGRTSVREKGGNSRAPEPAAPPPPEAPAPTLRKHRHT